MAAVTFSNLLGTIENTAAKVGQIVPVIRSTVENVTTIAQDKRPVPSPVQQGAAVSELTPGIAAAGISGALWIGALAVLAILFFAVKRR
jgi:hypothetical protein